MTKQAYLQQLKTRRRRRWLRPTLPFAGLLLSMLTMGALQKLVQERVFGLVSPESANYVLTTVLWNFSAAELRRIIHVSAGHPASFSILIGIYGLYYVIVGISLATFLLFMLVGFRTTRSNPEHPGDMLVSVVDLGSRISRNIDSSTGYSRWALRLRAGALPLSRVASPLREQFQANPATHWFTKLSVPSEARQIAMALERFPQALARAVRLHMDLAPFIRPVEHLENFFFTVAARVDNSPWLRNASKPGGPSDELGDLLAFAKAARPLILAAERNFRQRLRVHRHLNLVGIGEALWRSELVRNATGISLVAAIVMAVGVWVFGINPPQAFLAWFTVTFGVLSVSISVASFRLVRDEGERNGHPRRRSNNRMNPSAGGGLPGD